MGSKQDPRHPDQASVFDAIVRMARRSRRPASFRGEKVTQPMGNSLRQSAEFFLRIGPREMENYKADFCRTQHSMAFCTVPPQPRYSMNSIPVNTNSMPISVWRGPGMTFFTIPPRFDT
jgi:hypothetical protein